MQMSPPRSVPSPKDIFRDCICDEFCRELTRIVVRDYQRADAFCEEHFAQQEAHDTRPHIRRALIEQDVRNTARRFPHMAACAQPNSVNNCYHTEIRAGRVVLTISAVDNPEAIVREARFRLTYASEYQSAMPFMQQDNVEPMTERSVYAIVIHGPNPRERRLPGFVQIVFPVPDCTAYVAGRIDLLAEYPDVLDEFGAAEIIVPPTIFLRKDKMAGEANQDA
jgi:hypothetical protein